jgi:hypothetical protein
MVDIKDLMIGNIISRNGEIEIVDEKTFSNTEGLDYIKLTRKLLVNFGFTISTIQPKDALLLKKYDIVILFDEEVGIHSLYIKDSHWITLDILYLNQLQNLLKLLINFDIIEEKLQEDSFYKTIKKIFNDLN